MGVAYAKSHSSGPTALSRTFAINTWTIGPLLVKVAVGRPDGRCTSPYPELGSRTR